MHVVSSLHLQRRISRRDYRRRHADAGVHQGMTVGRLSAIEVALFLPAH